LVDELSRWGGSAAGLLAAPAAEREALRSLTEQVETRSGIERLVQTVAAGYYADHWVALVDRKRLTKMRAKAVVLATGVIEQPAVFRNNDLPGVMLASAAVRLASRYRVAPGRRAVIVGANLEAYAACLELLAQGVAVAAVVDLRSAAESTGAESAALVNACSAAGAQILPSHAPYQALRSAARVLCALEVAAIGADGNINRGALRRLECDAVLMSVGWAGAAQLLLQAGGHTDFSLPLQQFVPAELPPGLYAAGRLNGVYEFTARLADGERAGAAAAAHAGFPAGGLSGVATPSVGTAGVLRSTRCPSHRFPIIDHPAGRNFIDFDEDLQVKDLENAAQEGFDSSELLKRFSTVGMGPSQGKHSNMNALRVLARVRGLPVDQLGLTTARPMVHPVPLKFLAGRSFVAERRTPIDAIHAALGAVWMPAAGWRRPEYYAVAGESRAASIEAEVRAVRNAVGLIDVGTLGKIEVHGPQAGEFLDRAYTGKYSDLRVGMTRYALMLDESGVIIDDGVVARLAAEAFYFTTTTGGAATAFRELLRLNALWGLQCSLVNVTGHRAAFNFAGPASRELLQPMTDIDLSAAAFPYLGVRSGRVAGAEARLLRVGFVGELGYEIHVAAGTAAALWQTLVTCGLPRGLRAFGVEAQRVLRLEKGHFIVSQDTDGLTDPLEANAMWAVNMQKPFFIGQRSLRILKARGPRQLLAGLEFLDPRRLPREAHLVIESGQIAGRITSVTYSRALQKAIGLAMLRPDLARPGTIVKVRIDGGDLVAARVTPMPFYDPQNQRQKPAAAA
jgi:sarcosine oxidase subunit alpha